MALQHAVSGERIALQRGDDDIAHFTSIALVKTEHMELIRLVVPKEKPMPEHWVEGEMTLVCLEGEIAHLIPCPLSLWHFNASLIKNILAEVHHRRVD